MRRRRTDSRRMGTQKMGWGEDGKGGEKHTGTITEHMLRCGRISGQLTQTG